MNNLLTTFHISISNYNETIFSPMHEIKKIKELDPVFYLNFKDNCKIYKNQFKNWTKYSYLLRYVTQSRHFVQKFTQILIHRVSCVICQPYFKKIINIFYKLLFFVCFSRINELL
jgi:hypothetical protein